MLFAVACCASILTISGSEVSPLEVQMQMCAETIRLGDVVMVEVMVRNVGDEAVPLPVMYDRVLGTLSYRMHHYRSRYSFEWSDELGHGTGLSGVELLKAGESRVVVRDILEFPPIGHIDRDFWLELSRMEKEPFLTVVMYQSRTPRLETSLSCPTLRERQSAEMRFLTELYREMLQRQEKKVRLPKDFDWSMPQPGNFGLRSFEPYPDLVAKLLTYEEHLSPGSLRDIVHLTAVMQKLYHSRNQQENEELVDGLLKWLDALPEIERRCLGDSMISTLFHMYRDEPALNRLVYELVQRQPEKLYGFEDYRAYRLSGFKSQRPGFRAYLDEQRRQSRGNGTGPIKSK